MSKTTNQKRREKLKNKTKAIENAENRFLEACIKENRALAEKEKLAEENTTKTAEENATTTPGNEFAVPKEQILKKAAEMYTTIKAYVAEHPEYRDMKDQEKMELVRSKFGYAIFMEEFPVVSRYMVCFGQYSEKAFEKVLKKMEAIKHPPPEKREKNYMEDQWVRRQADYVQALWESYQKRHYNNAERAYIWQSTYEKLKREFDDFRNMHKEVEQKVKEEKKVLSGQNARELLERVVAGEAEITQEEQEALLAELERIEKESREPEKKEEKVEDVVFGKEPKVVMIETVDVERMGEIDDQYKPPELRGMEPVLDGALPPTNVQRSELEVVEEVEEGLHPSDPAKKYDICRLHPL